VGWKEIEDYAYTDNLNNQGWAWEFLRRNQAYVSDYNDYCGVILKHKKNSNSQPLQYFNPEKKEGETTQQWRARCMATEATGSSIDRPATYYGKKWHLKNILPPQTPYPIKDLFILPWPKIVDPDSFDDFYYTPNEELSPTQPVPDKILLAFDLSLPIKHQLKQAKSKLNKAQNDQKNADTITPLKTKEHTQLWLNYLRILDAMASTPKPTYLEIADILFKDEQGVDPKGKVKDAHIQALKQSKRYLNILYRTKSIHKTFSGK